jgi:DNA processing protein
MQIESEKLIPWLALKQVRGIGNVLYRRIIEHFGSPESAFAAKKQALMKISGISEPLAEAIKRHKITDSVEKEIVQTYENGFHIITCNDPEYPQLLIQIPDPPPYLYAYGKIVPDSANIAIVGSRHATSYGMKTARRIASQLASAGIIVVSGMARGIDTAAHTGAVEKGHHTYAVLGSGLCRIYPPQNKTLFHQIARNGSVVSEFPLHAAPEAHHFPIRNRIISGMCLGVLVVEASRKSGSLITARLAAEQNREVFAVPGSIQSFKSAGTHQLIKQGAKLVEKAQDILDEIQFKLTQQVEPQTDSIYDTAYAQKNVPHSEEEKKVLSCLCQYPTHIDELKKKVDLDSGKLAAILLKLELDGTIEQWPGKNFILKM